MRAKQIPDKQYCGVFQQGKILTYFFPQIVCSFLVRDMNIDWRMGAEWFETCLLDYDPCSNYGNWTYGAGKSLRYFGCVHFLLYACIFLLRVLY